MSIVAKKKTLICWFEYNSKLLKATSEDKKYAPKSPKNIFPVEVLNMMKANNVITIEKFKTDWSMLYRTIKKAKII